MRVDLKLESHNIAGTKLKSSRSIVTAAILFFVSGTAALIYEVLWMKELSLLFGNSAQAAAATLSAFFAGIAAGNAYWGRRTSKMRRPLLLYGLLELGVTASAALYFGVFALYDLIYPMLYGLSGDLPAVFTAAKFFLALMLFFPAAFFMGGTLPVMTQYLVRNMSTLGKRASLLYALNTVGAATGALIAGFYLPQALGFQNSYLVAMACTATVGLLAVLIGREVQDAPIDADADHNSFSHDVNLAAKELYALAALSGFASLGLQVLWIRMFAQVLHNSVYTYAVILSVFLVALALGGAVARELAARNMVSRWLLPILLTLTGLFVAGSPLVFSFLTEEGSYIGGSATFVSYILEVVWVTFVSIGIPTLAIGVLLPYLFKLAERSALGAGQTVGRILTVNTVFAILGSLAAGFVLLGWVGMWGSIQLMAAFYIAAALWILVEHPTPSVWVKAAPILGVLLLLTILDTTRLPVVRVDPINKNEMLLEVWEESDATVAVIRRNGFLRTKLNNWYTLGSSGDMITQQVQTHLPMLLHPNPKRVFYLGMGTGITAGTALSYDVESVLVSEIAPSVIKASRTHFGEYTNGLYEDSRVRVVAEDGRNVLRGTESKFDLIISDLFIPWKAGSGTLYSVEHYATAKERLRSGGLYVQWLPLYQLTEQEFAIIAKTMSEVFPTITMWRGNYAASKAVIALVGHVQESSIEPSVPLLQASRQALSEHIHGPGDTVPMIAHYLGQLREDMLVSSSINTDNNPIIEYLAPINHRRERAGLTEWFISQRLIEFLGPHVTTPSLQRDSFLSGLDQAWFPVVQAGYYLQLFYFLEEEGHQDAEPAKQTYVGLLRESAENMFDQGNR